ncbi:outer membrane protein transport protein [Parabacteroides sp. PF5-9]|uniref:OmpP1/FadL family transporter n=1 Tax=Parabacteroides sp. PF5-9 TaxID=1742404 RepID=UPI0024748E68|nr:outer membrane protein transport protein [Parabacteroides sp. PF5-9]MDH6358674.1 long-chain fatty acid transport protein [Parabacteroides sp. PF5-9]
MKKIIALVCLSLLPFSYLSAEGYQVNAQSTKQAAMGHVGVAMKLGAESMHFNPAGLGFLNKNVDLSLGVTGVFANAKFSDNGYTHKSDNDPSTPLYFYAGFKIYDFLSAGISVNTPYGSSMDWGSNWKGSHLIQKISLKSYSIQPTLSWKIMDRLSVGAGMMIMFGDFSLSRALLSSGDLSAIAAGMPALQPLADKYKDITPVSVELSGDAGLRVGYNVGVMFDVTDQITIGASYRSKVMMKVSEGSALISYANESELKPILGGNVPPLDKGFLKAELPLPSNFSLGVTYQPTTLWTVSGEVQFVGWGAYQSLPVDFYPESELGKYNQNPEKKYKNTRIYRVGTQYAATNRLDVRLGAYYDETPVKDDYLNPETPSMNKLGLTTGFSFRPTNSFSVDLSFSYVTGFGRDGSYSDKSSLTGQDRTFGGHYKVYALMPAIGVSYQF